MAHLEVPARYTSELKELAQRDARPVQDVVSEAMDAYLSFRFNEARLTTAHMERMKESLRQAERGDLVSAETVDAFFEDGKRKLLPVEPLLPDRARGADLADIRRYFTPIPERFGAPIRHALRAMLHEVAANPQRGNNHSEASRLLGEEVRTRAVPPYRIFYRDLRGTPEVLAVLHTAQDVSTLLNERLQ